MADVVLTETCQGCGRMLRRVHRQVPSWLGGKPISVVEACPDCTQKAMVGRREAEYAFKRAQIFAAWGLPVPRDAMTGLSGMSEDASNRAALTGAREWVATHASKGFGILVYGPSGAGKSYLARAALYDLCRGNAETSTPPSVGMWLPEATIVKATEYDRAAMAEVARAETPSMRVVVVDDMGRRAANPRLRTRYLDIFEARARWGGATCVTTELAPEQLHDWCQDVALIRRVVDAVGADCYKMDGAIRGRRTNG